jgi:hypothetical protein
MNNNEKQWKTMKNNEKHVKQWKTCKTMKNNEKQWYQNINYHIIRNVNIHFTGKLFRL